MTPLTNNRLIGGGLTSRAWGFLGTQEFIPIHNVLDDTGLKPLLELTDKPTLTHLHSFRYMQLQYFYNSL
ncbi:Hypothetical predicted protein [Pelobates cultripes]|uniref:Uncharacterized protein n=1 Tax=Pelobates cultripes TaxID=61616 RepID=A0AAD1TM45_PELCU|nr:Hypothetical predicted protein [Pelobates cultripes]